MNLSKRDADTRMNEFNPERPYNNLPPLPPKAEIESRPILKACIGARAALGELKQAGGLLPRSVYAHHPALFVRQVLAPVKLEGTRLTVHQNDYMPTPGAGQ